MPLTPATIAPTTYQGSDYGYVAMSYDPAAATTTSTPLTPAGTVWTVRLPIRKPVKVTNVVIYLQTGGSGLTANQCLAGLYNSAGTLLSATGNQATAWAGTGAITMALTTAQFCTPGLYDVAFFYNGTTGPAPLRTGATQANLSLTGSTSRNATADTGRTTTLASTLGTKTASAITYWAALS